MYQWNERKPLVFKNFMHKHLSLKGMRMKNDSEAGKNKKKWNTKQYIQQEEMPLLMKSPKQIGRVK